MTELLYSKTSFSGTLENGWMNNNRLINEAFCQKAPSQNGTNHDNDIKAHHQSHTVDISF